jgi:hypothetical protein
MVGRSHEQIRQAIRGQEPPRPSSALRAMSERTLVLVRWKPDR